MPCLSEADMHGTMELVWWWTFSLSEFASQTSSLWSTEASIFFFMQSAPFDKLSWAKALIPGRVEFECYGDGFFNKCI